MVKFMYDIYIYIYIFLICGFSFLFFISFVNFLYFKNGDDILGVQDNLAGFNLNCFMLYAFHHISYIMVYLQVKFFF